MRIAVIDMEATCKNLKRICTEKGYGISRLQHELGLESRQAIYKWFSGKSIPGIDNLILISELLGITLDELIIRKYIDL